jgi:hypothetical protein
MNQELLNQAKAMFDSPEKWNAFLELLWQKDNIKNQWYLNLKEDITKTFSTDFFSKDWDIKIRGNFSYQWFLKAYGENSISIWIEDGILSLFASDAHDIEEVYKLIKSENFAPLVNCFKRIDVSYQGGYIIKEERNFSFGTSTDERFDFEKLAWFAGYRTKEFTKQIADKVNRFRLNEDVTNLLSELNRQTRKQ